MGDTTWCERDNAGEAAVALTLSWPGAEAGARPAATSGWLNPDLEPEPVAAK